MDHTPLDIRAPRRWIKFLRALMGLHPGRYSIVLSIWATGIDYSIISIGEVRVERD